VNGVGKAALDTRGYGVGRREGGLDARFPGR